MKTILTSIVLLLLLSSCNAEGPTKMEEDALFYNRDLARTIAMGNALEAPVEGEWDMVIKKEYFELIKDVGFTAVRIPIKWSAHAAETAPYTIDSNFFERIDEVLAQALEQDLAVILDFHHYWAMDAEPEENLDRWLAIWAQIAQRYAEQDKTVFFEILNEPHDNISDELWNRFLLKGIAEIRKSNPERILIVGPSYWNAHWKLKELELPENDRKIIATFHYYDPFEFTHQGAEWVDPSPPVGKQWHESDFSPPSDWQNWSWDSDFELKGDALQLNFKKAWAGFYLHRNSPIAGFKSLSFSTDKAAKLSILCSEDDKKGFQLNTSELQAGYIIDLKDCGAADKLDRIIIQSYSDKAQRITISDLKLIGENKEQYLISSVGKEMKNSFKHAFDWARAHNRPLFMGEFGAYSKADLDSRIRWTKFVRETAEEYNISWSYWEFGAGFGLYDRAKKSWRLGLLKALIPE